MLNKLKWVMKPPRDRLHGALLILKHLNVNDRGTTAVERHCII